MNEKQQKRKLLWVGDAAVSTGFAKITHNVCDRLYENDWDVSVLGVNYFGDPHPWPYSIYPTTGRSTGGGYDFGLSRIVELVSNIQPDIVVVANDPWNVPEYLKRVGDVPVVATMAVDGRNCRGDLLNGLTHAIFWTQFALDEAREGGYAGSATVVPLGVDLEMFHSVDKDEALRRTGKPELLRDAFILGNVNRNQPRKRLDLTVAYFAQWVREYDVRNAYLYMHLAPTGDIGYDIYQLMRYYGVANRLIYVEHPVAGGVEEADMIYTYGTFDLQMSTTQGEGWGLTTMEGMACGIPQVIPDWSALGEWAIRGTELIPCTTTIATSNFINAIGGVPDKEKMIEAFDRFYRSEGLRGTAGRAAREHVARPEFRWDDIAERYREVLETSLFTKGMRNKLPLDDEDSTTVEALTEVEL